MSLLLEEDYKILEDHGLKYIEDKDKHYLIIQDYPLPEGMYESNGQPVQAIEVLVIIPGTYNTEGTDMLWTHPVINRIDSGSMPNVAVYGDANNIVYNEKEYCRWSRHYEPASWKPKVDNVQKILSRIEWALKKPATT